MFGSSFGNRNRSKNIYDNNPSAGNSYKPNFGANFGANFGSNNNFSSSVPSSGQNMMNNPAPKPMMPQQPMMNMQSQQPMQQPRAMMPSQGFNPFWNPQGMGNVLRNTETGQDVDLSKNQMPAGIDRGMLDKFRGRIFF